MVPTLTGANLLGAHTEIPARAAACNPHPCAPRACQPRRAVWWSTSCAARMRPVRRRMGWAVYALPVRGISVTASTRLGSDPVNHGG